MYYEVCFIREDLPVGLARDIFLDPNGGPLCSEPKLAGYLTYSRAIDLQDGGQYRGFVDRVRLASDLPDCSYGPFISETLNEGVSKRNVRVGLVYYAGVKFHDALGGSGWCVVKPCNENKGKASGLKLLR